MQFENVMLNEYKKEKDVYTRAFKLYDKLRIFSKLENAMEQHRGKVVDYISPKAMAKQTSKILKVKKGKDVKYVLLPVDNHELDKIRKEVKDLGFKVKKVA